MTRIVIVGGGLAAAALVGSLRRRGFAGAVTVLCAESLPPYDRPPLSKELFSRDAPAWLSDEFALADDAATWVLGTRAAALVPGGVADSTGRVWEADEVVLAMGVAPRASWAGTHTLHTWDDATALRRAFEGAQSAAIVGAGWLGLELASVARSRGIATTLIDATAGPLGTLLPHAVSARIGEWVTASGATFVGGATVAHAGPTHATTTNGALAADCVAVTLGSAPQTAWLPPELLAPTGHVRADGDGRVRERLWAIGDCAALAGATHPHWNDAIASAERCAAAIVGDELPRPHVPHGFSTLFGHDVQMLGTPNPALAVEFAETPTGWTAHMMHDGALRAVLAVDSPREVAKARKALAILAR